NAKAASLLPKAIRTPARIASPISPAVRQIDRNTRRNSHFSSLTIARMDTSLPSHGLLQQGDPVPGRSARKDGRRRLPEGRPAPQTLGEGVEGPGRLLALGLDVVDVYLHRRRHPQVPH